MAFGLEALALPLIAGAAGTAVGGVASMLMKPKTPAMPSITMPEIPDPIAPPNAPLSPSQTAALQKARARTMGGTGNKDIVLTSASQRSSASKDDPTGLVSRTTLLGR